MREAVIVSTARTPLAKPLKGSWSNLSKGRRGGSLLGISAHIYGRVYTEMLLESPVHLSQFIQPRIEPELAVVLRDDLPAQASPEEARRAVSGIFWG